MKINQKRTGLAHLKNILVTGLAHQRPIENDFCEKKYLFQIVNCRKENRWILIDNFHFLFDELYLLKLPNAVNSNFRIFFITDHEQMSR